MIASGEAKLPRERPPALRSVMTPLSPRVATYFWAGSSVRPPATPLAESNTIRLAVFSSTRTSPPPASAPICAPE